MFLSAIESFLQLRNYPSFQPKVIFFDMDGVLYDSMKSHASAWVSAMTDIKIPFTPYEAYMNEGRTGQSTIDGAYQQHRGRNATEEEKQQIYKLKTHYFELCGPTEKMPYAHEVLKKVQQQGLGIFIVTGSGQLTLIDNLESSFPGVFHKERLVTAFDVIQGKPHPEPYLKALAKAGVQPWEALVIENAPLGVESAVAAGIFTVAVNTGPLESKILYDSGANIVLDGGMSELYEKWEQLSSIQILPP
ncbi:MAG: HAD-IA family hydrolase [Bacteroidales bacterium]|nr:HAD-IA family hydrolase [Bacteroidales bacterium]